MRTPASSDASGQESWILQAQQDGLEPIFESGNKLADSDDQCDRRLNRLAMLSTAFSCLASILGPIGFVPGILLGHAAYVPPKDHTSTCARRLAIIGLLCGYGYALAGASTIVICLMCWFGNFGTTLPSVSSVFAFYVIGGVLYAAMLAWLWLTTRWGRTGLLCNAVLAFAVCFGSLAALWLANAHQASREIRKSNQLREYGQAVQQYIDTLK